VVALIKVGLIKQEDDQFLFVEGVLSSIPGLRWSCNSFIIGGIFLFIDSG